MFRLAYRRAMCVDCGEPNHWPVCGCGCQRPLDDEFFVVSLRWPVRWTAAGPVPRVQAFTRFELQLIRDALTHEVPVQQNSVAEQLTAAMGDVYFALDEALAPDVQAELFAAFGVTQAQADPGIATDLQMLQLYEARRRRDELTEVILASDDVRAAVGTAEAALDDAERQRLIAAARHVAQEETARVLVAQPEPDLVVDMGRALLRRMLSDV